MGTSYNLLYIKDLEVASKVSYDGLTCYAEAKMVVEVRFNCPVTHNTFSKLTIITKGRPGSPEESMRNCIESLFNGKFYDSSLQHFEVDRYCVVDRENIHNTEYSHLPEEFKKMFDDLFSVTKWKIPLELPAVA